jgi:predicted nicotinamide N-methyase
MSLQDHVYEMEDRRLSFEGYSLKGVSDLTSIGKATGEALWLSSLLLADYLANEWEPETTRNVLELGCGLGLCGTVASIRLGKDCSVVLTDGDTGVLERAKIMSDRNSDPTDAPVTHSRLLWGDVPEMASLNLGGKEANYCGYDLIVASDIIYDSNAEATANDFATTVDSLLAHPNDPARTSRVIPKCFVGFQQRGIPVEVLYEAFSKRGFVHSFPAGEYFEDIYEERHDEHTMFTNRFLICFDRKPHTTN